MPANASTAFPVLAATDDGREDAWRALYDEHFGWVYRLVCRFGATDSDAEDLTQQVFVIAYRRMADAGAIESVAGWLRGITVRVVSGHHRWRKVRRVKQWLVEAAYRPDAAAVPTPERRAQAAQTRALVGEVLAAMSPKLRAVLVLADIEELAVSEVAEALRIPVNTVRSRRRLARAAFQRLWRAAGGEERP